MSYQLMWDTLGYGTRHARIMATGASHSRKLLAVSRLWSRMTKLHGIKL